jgi:hypothetical protein
VGAAALQQPRIVFDYYYFVVKVKKEHAASAFPWQLVFWSLVLSQPSLRAALLGQRLLGLVADGEPRLLLAIA